MAVIFRNWYGKQKQENERQKENKEKTNNGHSNSVDQSIILIILSVAHVMQTVRCVFYYFEL